MEAICQRSLFYLVFSSSKIYFASVHFLFVQKGPPVVRSPSQVIMVPCVLGWEGAFSLKAFLWQKLCLFQRWHLHLNHRIGTIKLFFLSTQQNSLWNQRRFFCFYLEKANLVFSLWPGTRKNLFLFSSPDWEEGGVFFFNFVFFFSTIFFLSFSEFTVCGQVPGKIFPFSFFSPEFLFGFILF